MKLIPKEWLGKPDEKGEGLLSANVSDGMFFMPLAIETHNVDEGEVTLGTEQEFTLILESAGDLEIYEDEEDFMKKHKGGMAPESFIPCGTFSVHEGEDYEPSATAIMNAVVVETYDDPLACGFEECDVLLTLTCLGQEFDVVVHDEEGELRGIREGNIVSGGFWIQGWPEE